MCTKQRNRVCVKCKEQVNKDQKGIFFNHRLSVIQAELLDLQQQIAAVVDEVLLFCLSVCLNTYLSVSLYNKDQK